MLKYKLIIFDFDGTLGDTYHWFGNTINSAAQIFRFKKIRPEDAPILREMDTPTLLKHLGVSLWKLPFISAYMRFRMSKDLHTLRTFKGVERMLEMLHAKGVKLAIVSSNSHQNVRGIILGEHADMITHYECGSSLMGKKDKFLRVIQNLGMRPEEVLCIGDESRDVEAAKEAGMASGAVVWGYAGRNILEKASPNYIFEKLEEIASFGDS